MSRLNIGPPLSRKAQRDLDRQEREFHEEIRIRMDELMAKGMPKQDAFDQAWVDCGGLIIPDRPQGGAA